MHPNFDVINAMFSSHLIRTMMSAAKDGDRALLESRFPECYSETQTLPIPLSYLKQRVVEYMLKAGEANPEDDPEVYATYGWHDLIMEHLGIPYGKHWQYEYVTGNSAEVVPEKIWSQLVGKEYRSFMEVTYENEKFYVVYLVMELKRGGKCGSGLLGEKIQPLTRYTNLGLSVVHSSFIDLNS